MGVEYERWLVAKQNVFSPSAAGIVKLVEKLRAENWIIAPADAGKLRLRGKREENARASGGYAVRTVENQYGTDVMAKIAASTEPLPAVLTPEWLDDPTREELRLVWPVSAETLPVQYPLTRRPEGEVSFALEIHRAPDYVYPISESLEALDTTCNCDEDLAFEWDDEELVPSFGASTGIYTECEECSRTFDPAKLSATLTNPFDGTSEEVMGGAAYRFAIKVACGKNFVEDPKLAFAPELVLLLEKEFGRTFYEFGSTY